MRTQGSESFIVLPLLPIFLIGLFPMLLLSLLGPAGLIILGILVASAGLTDILDANSTFSEQIIVHGYARGSERTGQRTRVAFGNALCVGDDRCRCRPCGRRHRRPGAIVRPACLSQGCLSRTRRLRTPQKFEHGRAARRQCRRVPQQVFMTRSNGGKFQMLKFYFNGSPNPTKVALFLEEAGIAYQPVAVDTRKGDQFKPEYLAINPNAKVPAIDDDGVKVFDSNAILLYLAEKTGKFLPANTPANRGELLSWLMFVATGVGPYSGQAVHFKHFAPEKIDYAHNRYQFEAQRHFGILNDHLASRRYMVGDTYTIVDMDVWGWARMMPFVMGEDAVAKYPNVKRLVDEIMARPAAAKAIALKDSFKFKAEMDDEARGNMFKHMSVKAA